MVECISRQSLPDGAVRLRWRQGQASFQFFSNPLLYNPSFNKITRSFIIFTILIFVNQNYSQHIDSTKVKSKTRIKVNNQKPMDNSYITMGTTFEYILHFMHPAEEHSKASLPC
jgi:hypothetical protein